MSYVLAIDVGTSFTAAALLDTAVPLLNPDRSPHHTPEILPLGLHGSAVPSVLFFAPDGRVLVGEAAERRGLDDPQRMVREFKRRIGDSVPLSVGDGWHAPEDIYATMARWVVDRAVERQGSPPSSIIMTHPAAWGQHRISLVLEALGAKGLAEVTLISEPEAAALHYASQTRVEDGSTIAVYDLGGGTFDTAVLRKAGAGKFELLGRPDGIETLGGADFDAAILRHVMGYLGDAVDALEPGDPATLAAFSRLRRECREAKEALSWDSEASVAVALPGVQQSVRLVRSEFEAMIEAPVRDTVEALERSLRSVNREPQDLSAVLLIGGSSRIPLVAQMISVELGRPIAVDADPKVSICLGAAVSGLRTSVDAEAAPAEGAPAVERPRSETSVPVLSAVKATAERPGRHAPRPRARLAAAAAVAATVLTIATATAAQSPEGTGLLTSMFGAQAADVMRDGQGTGEQSTGAQGTGTQGSGTRGSGAGGGAKGAVGSKQTAGLDASARAGTTRTGATKGTPAKQGASDSGTGTGSAGSGSGSDTAVGGGPGAGGTTGGTPNGTTPTTPPAPAPSTSPTDPGGAASGPTPDPVTPPPSTSDPSTPPDTTPPTTTPDPVTPSPDPVTPSPDPVTPTPDPVEPTPEPTGPLADPPATADPVPDPVIEPTPVPSPTESSPGLDPLLTSVA